MFETSLRSLEAQVKISPRDPIVAHQFLDALDKVGNLYASQGCWEEAAACLQRALDLAPNDESKWHGVAAVLAQLPDAAPYSQHCRKMLAHFQNTTQPFIASVTTSFSLLRPAEGDVLRRANELFKRGGTLTGDNSWNELALFCRGQLDYRNGSLESARTTLESMPVRFSVAASNAMFEVPRKAIIAMALYRTNHRDDAQKVLVEAIREYDQLRGSSAVLAVGWEAVPSRALLNEAHQLIEGTPIDDTFLHLLRAHVYGELGMKEKSEIELKAVPQPNSPKLYTMRGLAWARLGLKDRALEDFARAVAMDPDDIQARQARASFLIEDRRWKEAQDDMTKCVTKVKEGSQCFQLAALLIQAKDPDAYHKHCESLLARFSGTADAYMAERTAKACLFLPPEASYRVAALRMADKAVVLDPHNWVSAYICFAKALAEYRRNNCQDAAAWCRKVLAQEAKPWTSWYLKCQARSVLAMVLARLHETDTARAELKRAIELYRAESPKFEMPGRDPNWHDWIICRFLIAEAEETIGATNNMKSSPTSN
jgi:tetratricopeptide (TPR) repeat protein